MDHNDLLAIIADQYKQILHENLVGIYVHGSIAFGCFDWSKSDIDFIVVVNNLTSLPVKRQLLQVLEDLSGKAPPKGFEMSVVQKKFCGNFIYPTPYELHFSNGYPVGAHTLGRSLCKNQQTDHDLAAHFTIIKHVGIVLCGAPVSEVFGHVSKEYYLDSICRDVENAAQDVAKYPAYIVLNLCRVYAYIRDGLILSKDSGGRWGLENLPQMYHEVIADALDGVARRGHMRIEFCKYVGGLIDYEKSKF